MVYRSFFQKNIFYIFAIFFSFIFLSDSYAALEEDSLTLRDGSDKIIAIFTLQQLKVDFQQKNYLTQDPWNPEMKLNFRGPSVRDVLERAKIAHYSNLKIIAYDDYSSQLTHADIQTYDPILAIERECNAQDYESNLCQQGQQFKPIPFSEKGSIRLIWPYEQFPSGSFPLLSPFWIYSIQTIQVIP